MRHVINQSVENNQVGIPQSTDGIMMLFLKAVAVASTFVLDTAYLISSADDLTAMGITQAYDDANNVALYQQITEFYAQPNNGNGTLLWFVGVDKADEYPDYVGEDIFTELVHDTAATDFTQRAKGLGFCFEKPTVVQSAADFPSEVTDLLVALQAVQLTHFNAGFPWFAIIDGYNMSSTATPTTIQTMADKACPSLSMCITGTIGNGISAVGAALGRFAAISIGHGFGAVEDGPINVAGGFLTCSVVNKAGGVALVVGGIYTVYGPSNATVVYNAITYTPQKGKNQFTAVNGHTDFTATNNGYVVQNAKPVQSMKDADVNALGDKQYMFLRTWPENAGFFWNDAATTEDPTFQLYTQENNRVANYFASAARTFFTRFMGKNLPLEKTTGAVSQNWLNGQQENYFTTYVEPKDSDSGTGDITTGGIVITGPNFNSTRTLLYTVSILPTPIVGGANGLIRFTSTFTI